MIRYPSNFEEEISAIKEHVKTAMENAAKLAVQDTIKDVQSRIKIITSSDFNNRIEWFISPKTSKKGKK